VTWREAYVQLACHPSLYLYCCCCATTAASTATAAVYMSHLLKAEICELLLIIEGLMIKSKPWHFYVEIFGLCCIIFKYDFFANCALDFYFYLFHMGWLGAFSSSAPPPPCLFFSLLAHCLLFFSQKENDAAVTYIME
jgi:hypothetical protein